MGDYIDRGSQSCQVYKLVRSMVESDDAIALMGNHEFNIVCYHTKDERNGGYLWEHNLKNQKHIAETLKDIDNHNQKDLLDENVEWFRNLPLWYEIEGV